MAFNSLEANFNMIIRARINLFGFWAMDMFNDCLCLLGRKGCRTVVLLVLTDLVPLVLDLDHPARHTVPKSY